MPVPADADEVDASHGAGRDVGQDVAVVVAVIGDVCLRWA